MILFQISVKGKKIKGTRAQQGEGYELVRCNNKQFIYSETLNIF